MATGNDRCQAKRKDGSDCQGTPLESGYCFAHDPALKELRAEARRKGGANSAKIVRLRGLVPPRLVSVYDKLEAALSAVEAGTLSPRQAQAMAAVARAMVSVLQSGELEERMRALEQNAGQEGRRWQA